MAKKKTVKELGKLDGVNRYKVTYRRTILNNYYLRLYGPDKEAVEKVFQEVLGEANEDELGGDLYYNFDDQDRMEEGNEIKKGSGVICHFHYGKEDSEETGLQFIDAEQLTKEENVVIDTLVVDD